MICCSHPPGLGKWPPSGLLPHSTKQAPSHTPSISTYIPLFKTSPGMAETAAVYQPTTIPMSRPPTRSNTLSHRFTTPPSLPVAGFINTSATTSPTTVQPTQATPGVSSPHQLRIDPGGRWGWVSRHPIAMTFAIIVLVVVVLIIVMIVTLNSDVQQLYNQIPYGVTGVSA